MTLLQSANIVSKRFSSQTPWFIIALSNSVEYLSATCIFCLICNYYVGLCKRKKLQKNIKFIPQTK